MNNINKSFVVLAVVCFHIISCQTIAMNPYPGLEIRRQNNTSLYLTCSGKDELLIFIDGSGMNSVLGIKKGILWDSVQFAYYIHKSYKGLFDIAIPEKLDYSIGEDYQNDIEKVKKYTVDDLVAAYTQSIDMYLSTRKYSKVILFGISEGGLLLPRIYNRLRNKESITKMIVWGSGGYSQAECFKILANSTIPMPKRYREECLKIDNVIDEVNRDPLSISKYFLGWTYNRWSSFFKYLPIKEYETINKPILFVHGLYDYSSPVESVQYIQKTFYNKQYEYFIYEMGHIPDNDSEIDKILFEISEWIKE